MRVVGLTGDIASGKSTVSSLLAARGAVIVDADRIAREVVEPGSPALDQIVSRFGRDVLQADGFLDRDALARLVFSDEQARKDLEAITHPAIGAEIMRQAQVHAETDRIVVLDIPLMRDKKRYPVELMIVVTAPEDERVRRLVADRGSSEDDARARIGAQAHLADRVKEADVILDNSGRPEDLERQVDDLWAQLTAPSA